MPVQTPTPVKGTPRNSTNTTPELPTRRSWAAHWRSQLTQEDRVDPIELHKKLRLLLVNKFGEDFVPRPVQIEARAGLFQPSASLA
ncbi:BQ5605_C030g10837 [Microbotryum silenes-dioicae]|uniref:BQ5605_C030g10837 protein n=1 Tax=Microbotryum silenes-dioicae TaxID=796604 RepID=A0A2X0MLU6_9BASI|nr:BQ5605_C030g10837 [Microbotryum silenes-dioicae]